jgi:TolB-like protein
MQRRVPALAWVLAALAVIALGFIVAKQMGGGDRAAQTIESLAVLPFDNLMNDPEQDYLVEGMQEALITDLSKITSLRVVSRTSAMLYKDSDKSIPQIADELGVDALVEGSVLRDGGHVRVTAQLIHGETDAHLWADDYDREFGNALLLTSEVAEAIAGEINVALSTEERQRLESAPAVSPEVEDLYLRANYLVNKFTPESTGRALELYRQIVEIDPSFARAHVGIAMAQFLRGGLWWENPSETLPAAEEAAQKALALDSDLSGAHTAMGWLYLAVYRQFDRAESEFTRALDLNPNDPYARHGLADLHLVTGDMEESVKQVKLGRECDPFSPMMVIPVVGHLFYAGRNDEARAEAEAFLEIVPENRNVHFWLAESFWREERYEEAFAEYDLARGEGSPLTEAMRTAFEKEGPEAAMHAAAEYLVELSRDARISPYAIASYYARGGDPDRAFHWLETAMDKGLLILLHVKADPHFASLRTDPRYPELLQRLGFPEEAVSS